MSSYMKKPEYIEAVQIVEKNGKLVIDEDPLPKWVEDLFNGKGTDFIEKIYYDGDRLMAYIRYFGETDLREGRYIIKDQHGRTDILHENCFKFIYEECDRR